MLKNTDTGLQNYVTIVDPKANKALEVRIEEVVKLLSIIGNTQILSDEYMGFKVTNENLRELEDRIWNLVSKYYIGMELPPIIPKVSLIDQRTDMIRDKQHIGLEFGIVPNGREETVQIILNYLFESIGNIYKSEDITFDYIISRLVDPYSQLRFDILSGKMVVDTNIEDFNRFKWKEYCRINLEKRSNLKFDILDEAEDDNFDKLKDDFNNRMESLGVKIKITDLEYVSELDKVKITTMVPYDGFITILKEIESMDLKKLLEAERAYNTHKNLNKKSYINNFKKSFQDTGFKNFDMKKYNKQGETSIGDIANHINDKKIDKQISLF